MFHNRIVVFKEIKVNDQTMYQWFREADETSKDWIVEWLLLNPEQHWELLEGD